MARSSVLKVVEYERILALANNIASLAKRGLSGYETLSVNDHTEFLYEIDEVTMRITNTVRGS